MHEGVVVGLTPAAYAQQLAEKNSNFTVGL